MMRRKKETGVLDITVSFDGSWQKRGYKSLYGIGVVMKFYQSIVQNVLPHTGRPRVTTPKEDRYLAVTAKRHRRSTASDLSRQLSFATCTTVSRQTVYRHLGHIGLYARRPVGRVPLTATHCPPRFTWSREHAL
ncbi:transposable element Tcb2 transposase [Trichonephila clavipes]|nr:transposable element Tcb2 transposase [Trichonephila clavipes]